MPNDTMKQTNTSDQAKYNNIKISKELEWIFNHRTLLIK